MHHRKLVYALSHKREATACCSSVVAGVRFPLGLKAPMTIALLRQPVRDLFSLIVVLSATCMGDSRESGNPEGLAARQSRGADCGYISRIHACLEF